MRFAYSIPDFRGFNQDFTRGTAEVRASWIRVAFATMVSALIQFILGGSATIEWPNNSSLTHIHHPLLDTHKCQEYHLQML